MATKYDFYEDAAVALEHWADIASKAVTNKEANLEWVDAREPYEIIQDVVIKSGLDTAVFRNIFHECLRGFAVSILTVVDGGTALSEKGRVYLVNEDGLSLSDSLHDDFISYLLDTNRLV